MENEMITNEIENNNDVILTEEQDSNVGGLVAGITLLTLAAAGIASIGKWAWNKAKTAAENRKAKKIREAEFRELESNQTDSAEESD